MSNQRKRPSPDAPKTGHNGRRGRKLLIVDPDHLTRWSVETYLNDAFQVISAPSLTEALKLLHSQSVEAVIVSDDLPDGGADQVEEHARSRNPQVVAVRTVTEPVRPDARNSPAVRLEKPFSLSALAKILGVPGR